jgi:hypothetical protein
MAIPTTRYARLHELLHGRVIASMNTTYHCCHIDELCIVFSESEGTRKVMIPTDVVLEWIAAYEFGIIDINMNARSMRDKVKNHSEWASYQHGFETHLKALVLAWDSAKST